MNNEFLSSLTPFVRDFAMFARLRGVKALFLVLLGVLVEGVGLLLLVPLLVVVIGTGPAAAPMLGAVTRLFTFFSADTRFEKLITLVVVFAVLMAVRAVVITARDMTLIRLETGFLQVLRSRLTGRLVAAEWSVVSRLRHSRVAYLIGSNAGQLTSGIFLLFSDSVALAMLVMQIAISIFLSPILALLVLGILLIGFATVLPLLERARKFGEFVADADLSLIHDMSQFLGALKLAISQNLQGSFRRTFEAALASRSAEQVRYSRRQTLMRLAVTTIAGMVGASAVVVGIAVLNVPASVLIALLLIFSRMNGPATQIYLDAQSLAQMLPAYLRILELESELKASAVALPAPAGAPSPVPEGAIELRDVTFVHSEASERDGGVHGLNLVLEPGSVVGIRGPSGSGKTTLADLLVGLYPAQSGQIVIGGTELSGSIVSSWRNLVSYVTQDAFLFHDTIRQNLLWSSPDRDDAALWQALEVAGIAEFVKRSGKGLETVVGERGSLVSGGERQRIAIARAILRQPRLLILDEATNAVDIESERSLLERMVKLKPRPTIVIVAHRPETLQCCERVLLLDHGTVVAEENVHRSSTRVPENGDDRYARLSLRT